MPLFTDPYGWGNEAAHVVSGGGGGNLAETTAWANQVVTNGGSAPSATQKGFVDTLVTTIKGGTLGPNLNSNLLRMKLLANFDNNEIAAFTDLIAPSSTLATKSGSFTSTTLGYQGNGSTGFIDTKFKPSTDGGALWTTSGASFGVYDLTSNTTAGTNISIGVFDGSNFYQILPLYSGATPTANRPTVSTNVGAAELNTTTNSQGFHVATQSDATHIRYKIYKGGAVVQDSGSVGGATQALASQNLYVCGRNNSGTADSFWAGKLALLFEGGPLSSAQMDDLDTAVQSYMTSLGINV